MIEFKYLRKDERGKLKEKQAEARKQIEEHEAYTYQYGGDLHKCSHGESFLRIIENRFWDDGLYMLDEPEAALSPSRQMTLLYYINELSKNGSQFIIATHSPIILAYKKGTIFDLNNGL